MAESIHSAVEKYQILRPTYDAFARKLESLLKDLLQSNNIKHHIVEARAKEVSSFSEKITRPGKQYSNPLTDIKDLCGCRVIVFYQDDVGRVADTIKSEFQVDEENLSHQPNLLEADRFGYLSAHYIVSLKDTRSNLVEWKLYDGFFAEIQVRTVIQHAWSAVSHTVLYKQEAGIPSMLQRRLHRIAGLFELADEEFVALRRLKDEAVEQIKQDISEGAESIPLSAASIVEFLKTWQGGKKLLEFAQQIGFIIADYDPESDYISAIYDLSNLSSISDLQQLENTLNRSKEDYFLRLIRDQNGNSKNWKVTLGFLVVLTLIYFGRDRVTYEFLRTHGFDDKIANHVLISANSTEPSKAGSRTTKRSTRAVSKRKKEN